jgi:hypothetical protein
MTFLAPWALVVAGLAAAGMVVLHLVARQRPAAYLLPTTRFIPDRRTLVSRAATRPRDLLLLALRVLLLLAAGAAFARPVLTPRRGAIARVILLDRSRAVASASEGAARVRTLTSDGIPTTIVAFDTVPTLVTPASLDSLSTAPRSNARGSVSAALIAARRTGTSMAERADSVQLVLVSPLAASEMDLATRRVRAEWPGAVRIERVAMRADSGERWRLERALPAQDPLAPSVASQIANATKITRLVRGPFGAADSAFASAGGTVVHWDGTAAAHAVPEGLAMGDDVIVGPLGRIPLMPHGTVRARWADGSAAAVESALGPGCVREVGIALPAAGDLSLHLPFQRIARGLLAPCGLVTAERAADSASVAHLAGATSIAAPASAMRRDESRPSPLARWLLGLAILLALAELALRARPAPEAA